MAQVVDSTNIDQFLTTGKVDEFKPPESPTTEDTSKESTKEPETDASKDEDDDKDLPERVRQQIGKKHRAMKEAEEFAEREYNQRRAAEKRADVVEAEKAALQQQLAEFQQKSRPAVVSEVQEPRQSDFNTVQEYVEALVNFKADQKLAKAEADKEQQRIANEAAQVRADFAERLTQTIKSVPDFEEVTSRAEVELPTHITQYILESPQGPMIGYHLSKLNAEDKPELNRILKLSPIRAIAELGKLETKFDKPPEKKVEQAVSKAPAPITPIEAKSTPVNPDLNRNMSFAEYKALKDLQAKRR